MRLLVVEDDAVLRRQLQAALQQAGFAVDAAADGIDGEHLGSVEAFDAVVLDLGLPGKDGLTILKAWRAHGAAGQLLRQQVQQLLQRHDAPAATLGGGAFGVELLRLRRCRPGACQQQQRAGKHEAGPDVGQDGRHGPHSVAAAA